MAKSKINSNPLELEEFFLDGLLKKRQEESELQRRKIESPIERRVFYLFFVCGMLALFLLLSASFFFQIINYGRYKALAEDNKFLNLFLKSERGIIYDRNMAPLVSNQARFDLYFNGAVFENGASKEDIFQAAEEAGKIVGLSKEESLKKMENFFSGASDGSDAILFFEGLTQEQLIVLEAKSRQIPAIKVKKVIKRDYLGGSPLSHILGYLGKIGKNETDILKTDKNYEMDDYIGKEGLEKFYEETLKEEKGIMEIERDVKGEEILKIIKKEPASGANLVLNLDFGLEKKITEVLSEILFFGQGKAAAAVALDPRTGGVLASVSLPGFDNNLFSRGISQEEFDKLDNDPRKPQLNKILGGVYAVGSTIKPFLGLAALEEGIIKEDDSFFCPEELCLENEYSKELECYKDWTFHGETDIRRAIAESVNPFFYIIGGGYERPKNHLVDSRLPKSFFGLGSRKIAEWLTFFGWGSKTGIDLPGEVAGRVPTPQWKEEYFSGKPKAQRIWYLGDTYNLSIGQGYVLTTPLQVATAFQAIANYGTVFKPAVVKEVVKRDKITEIPPQVLKIVPAKRENIEIVRQGMRQAVSSGAGSASLLNSLPVFVAAKTGTAETGKTDVFHNWITVFAPYEEPEIVLTVLIEDVEGLQRIAQVAARDILEWYFTQY